MELVRHGPSQSIEKGQEKAQWSILSSEDSRVEVGLLSPPSQNLLGREPTASKLTLVAPEQPSESSGSRRLWMKPSGTLGTTSGARRGKAKTQHGWMEKEELTKRK